MLRRFDAVPMLVMSDDSPVAHQVVVGDVRDRDDALEIINDELIMLAEKPKDKPATTLIVFPPKLFEQLRTADGMVDIATDVLGNFEEFLELAVDHNTPSQPSHPPHTPHTRPSLR
jgi:hypothetical protein